MKKGLFFSVPVMLAFAVGMAGAEPAKTEPGKAVEASQSPLAINHMANMYYRGRGVKPDHAKALLLYVQAAKQWHAASMIMAGYMYENGEGTNPDYAAAMQWYQKAAAQGYASAQQAICDLYRLGRGVSRDDAAAVQWYQKAVDQNFAEAQCRLGYMTLRGRGVPQDLQKARSILEAGVKQNNACSQHYLAFMYMQGLISMLPDVARALELDRQAAGNGDAEAQYNIGKANEIGWVEYANESEALSWYMHSAARGYPLAMERLAEVYEKGLLGQKIDVEATQMWRGRARAAWADWPEPRPEAVENIRFMPTK